MSALVGAVRRHPVTAYFLVTFIVSYAIAAPLVAKAQGLLVADIPGWLHYAFSLGPLVGAFVVTAITGGAAGLGNLVSRMVRWRIGLTWGLVAIGSPFVLLALAAIVTRLIEGRWMELGRLGEVNYLGEIGLWVVPLWIVTYGYGEETGWRGFALLHLQSRHTALVASLLVALGWMVWHLPAFFYLPTYTALPLVMLPFFFIGVALGSILLTWLYNGAGGSILAVAMWHAFWDLVSASKGSEGTPAAAMTMLIALWAIAIVVIGGPATLSRRPTRALAPA